MTVLRQMIGNLIV